MVFDALADPALARRLVELMAGGVTVFGTHGQLLTRSGEALANLCGGAADAAGIAGLAVVPLKAEQSNSSIRLGERLIMKLFRRIENGPNPDLEIGTFLTEQRQFKQVPAVVGAIEYRRAGQAAGTLAILQEFIPNRGDAWHHTLGCSGIFLHGSPPSNSPRGRHRP